MCSMTTTKLALIAALVTLTSAFAFAGEGATVRWKGANVSTESLPVGFPAGAVSAVETWGPWALSHRYRLELDASGRALLVLPGDMGSGQWMKAVDGALGLLDARLPAPVRAPKTPAAKPEVGEHGGSIPEDPEQPPSGGTSLDEVLNGKSEQWGAGTVPLDTSTVVMFLVRDDEDYAALLARLVEIAPYLGPWASTATKFPGFALEEPLAGAVVLGAAGQEEWDPENEVLHRVAELSLLRRYGRVPYWVLQGWAWHAEIAVKRSIYCFPYRDGFVGIGEHGGWDKVLKKLWSGATQPLAMSDVAALVRGRWNDTAAQHAWGTIAYFDRWHRAELPKVLDDLREAWDRGSRRDLGEGRWERIIGFEVPLDEQLAILKAHAGDDVLAELQRSFALGSGYKPSTAHR
jgi:hypothetical protein